MAPSACTDLSAGARKRLLGIARDAIRAGMAAGVRESSVQCELSESLKQPGGAFVTLTLEQRLRGCVGVLASDKALADTVADAAHSAAFKDHRFAPLAAAELEQARIEISVLSSPEAMTVKNREDLLAQLLPGIDGLVLQDGRHGATFLPKVWEQLTTPESFLDQLLLKAGLPADHWSESLQFQRYSATSFGETG